MVGLQILPAEILNLAIEHLVIGIGIQKAVLLRTVSRAFDAAILHAICISQVIDIYDPATPYLAQKISPGLRGKIILVKSRSVNYSNCKSYIQALGVVNRTLDSLIDEPDQKRVNFRHAYIAEAVIPENMFSVDISTEAQNLLCAAAALGNLSLVKLLLERNEFSAMPTDINGMTPIFHSPLTLAAAQGHIEVVHHLLDSGARVDSVSRYLHEYKKLVKLADWNGNDEELRSSSLCRGPPSALRAAVLGGHTEIVHLLLRPQHRLPIISLEYLRAIIAGAKVGRIDLIDALFEVIGKSLSDFVGFGQDMIWAAIRGDQRRVVQMLLDSGVDVNACPDYTFGKHLGTLSTAASLGNTSMVRFLLEQGANVNASERCQDGDKPIEKAALCGHEEVLELLIEHGADPADALHKAAQGGQIRLLNSLLKRFPDLPHRNGGDVGQRALVRALGSGNLTAITILTTAGVPLDDQGWLGGLMIDFAKPGPGPWVVNHLLSLGSPETDQEVFTGAQGDLVRGVRVSERTWEWVSRY